MNDSLSVYRWLGDKRRGTYMLTQTKHKCHSFISQQSELSRVPVAKDGHSQVWPNVILFQQNIIVSISLQTWSSSSVIGGQAVFLRLKLIIIFSTIDLNRKRTRNRETLFRTMHAIKWLVISSIKLLRKLWERFSVHFFALLITPHIILLEPLHLGRVVLQCNENHTLVSDWCRKMGQILR